MFKDIFKYKTRKHVLETGIYAKYLTKRKMRLIGAYRLMQDNKTVIDKNNVKYIIVHLMLKQYNGVNKETERQNYENLTKIHDKSEMRKKTIFIPEKKLKLDKNIEYYEKLNEHETRPAYAYGRYERIFYMQQLASRRIVSEYQFIEAKRLDSIMPQYQNMYNVTILENNELIDFLNVLHNGML